MDPLSLEGVGSVLNLDKQKLTEGKDLIKSSSASLLSDKSKWPAHRNFLIMRLISGWHSNIMPVILKARCPYRQSFKFPVPDGVWDEYHLDQEIATGRSSGYER